MGPLLTQSLTGGVRDGADATAYVIGYVPGAWDVFHIGHLNILRRAKLLCDYLMVGVVNDEVSLEQKGRSPIIPFHERLEIVRSIELVDAAVGEVTSDKMATWEQFRFDVIFKGDDWQGSPKWTRLEEKFAAVGVRVAYLPYTTHTSSTRLREVVSRLATESGG